VISFYLKLLNLRDAVQPQPQAHRQSFCFKPFFVTQMLQVGHLSLEGQYCFRQVQRQYKQVPGKDVFGLDKLVFPINVGANHWTCAVAHMERQQIHYHDSLGSPGTLYLEALLRYLQDEHLRAKKEPLPEAGRWRLVAGSTTTNPQQENGFDCGAFVCITAERLLSNRPLDFVQGQIPALREHLALATLQGVALPLWQEPLPTDGGTDSSSS
jgi:Ulp1 family protease